MPKIKVLIVDDSAVVRQTIKEMLEFDSQIEVIGTAPDPIFAMDRMQKSWPDVIILDVEMPRMDGITFLKKIMSERPTPVIMCSTLTEKGAQITLDALSSGAMDIITKPKIGAKSFLQEEREHFVQSVKSAAKTDMVKVHNVQTMIKSKSAVSEIQISAKLTADAVLSAASISNVQQTTDKVVAIGTSAGGTQALEVVLTALPIEVPGIVIVQHMPEKFTTAFAQRLNSISNIEVREAENGDRVRTGLALIAPGNKHMLLKRSGAQYHVEVKDGPLVSRHRPSVDVLFRSVAKFSGQNALGIIMTGMGDDGAAGMLEMHDAGVSTVAQNEETCVVFGMPNEAIKRGGVDKVLPLDKIAVEIIRYFRN